MIGSSVASWAAVTAAGGGRFNPELAFGIAAPLVAAVVSWRVVERTFARAPERVTSVLIVAFAAKMMGFGIYVGLLGALWLRPAPLAGAVMSWRVVERTHARAPERVTSVLIASLAAKMAFFGLYVGLLGALWLRPTPFVVTFAASFLVLHGIEAGYLWKLQSGGAKPVTC